MSERYQYISLDNYLSLSKEIKCGVSNVYILVANSFLSDINDLLSVSPIPKLHIDADDTSILSMLYSKILGKLAIFQVSYYLN